jgi:phage anti-repressor protein
MKDQFIITRHFYEDLRSWTELHDKNEMRIKKLQEIEESLDSARDISMIEKILKRRKIRKEIDELRKLMEIEERMWWIDSTVLLAELKKQDEES